MDRIVKWQNLGCVPYGEALSLQEELRAKRIEGKIDDLLLLLEHPPVFTMGRRDCEDDFISGHEEIEADGIEIVKTGRGGRVTYHGPGQLVGYFICDLNSLRLGVKDFVNAIEEICLRVLTDFHIRASRDEKHPGIWVGKNKIAAIGLNVSHNVTQHGFALNVDCDLDAYRHITPCGIQGRWVTSMEQHLKRAPQRGDIIERLIAHASSILSVKMDEVKLRT